MPTSGTTARITRKILRIFRYMIRSRRSKDAAHCSAHSLEIQAVNAPTRCYTLSRLRVSKENLMSRSCTTGLLTLIAVARLSAAEPRSLFDGKTFTGWEGDTAKTWRIED